MTETKVVGEDLADRQLERKCMDQIKQFVTQNAEMLLLKDQSRTSTCACYVPLMFCEHERRQKLHVVIWVSTDVPLSLPVRMFHAWSPATRGLKRGEPPLKDRDDDKHSVPPHVAVMLREPGADAHMLFCFAFVDLGRVIRLSAPLADLPSLARASTICQHRVVYESHSAMCVGTSRLVLPEIARWKLHPSLESPNAIERFWHGNTEMDRTELGVVVVRETETDEMIGFAMTLQTADSLDVHHWYSTSPQVAWPLLCRVLENKKVGVVRFRAPSNGSETYGNFIQHHWPAADTGTFSTTALAATASDGGR